MEPESRLSARSRGAPGRGNDLETILIAGGGIAGLTAALALAKTGRATAVLERAASFAEIGAGLQVSPNAACVLFDLGLGDALDKAAYAPDAIHMRCGRTGRLLKRLPVGAYCRNRFGHPYRVVHRADLLRILLNAAAGNPLISLHAAADVRAVDAAGDEIAVTTADGHAFRGAALVAADGVWSDIRAKCFDLPPALPTGRSAWRTIVPASALAGEHRQDIGLWMGPGAHLVHYPLRDGALINLVAVIDDRFSERTWDGEAAPEDLARAFRPWCGVAAALIDAPAAADSAWRRWPLYQTRPQACAIQAPIALIGDAWHASLPFMAQGAAMAIEDAAVLADCFARESGPLAAIRRFQNARLVRTGRLVDLAARNGRVYHMQGAAAFARDAAIAALPSGRLLAQFDWIYGWKPPAVT